MINFVSLLFIRSVVNCLAAQLKTVAVATGVLTDLELTSNFHGHCKAKVRVRSPTR